MIGERIKRLRESKGYSITELAKRSGVSKSYISNIERDLQQNPSLQFLAKIADPLDSTVEYILGMETEQVQLDDEWIELLKKAIDSGVTKKDFKEFQMFMKYMKWVEQQEQ
ncbi:helix-turn-helix domain-containing protein [Salinibacillus xinjiangensis]|uniref:Helix-turn-helix domain-containing protein n=1 Tax=Salinibacillus xinjiangensis TaxID=1229268 RepID=A0A6G1X2A5_9BACI|nr:helix-turn-helix domain-containing protein [Salinibacillus xinjiangensis]MRG85030.1 helix-turn-helix domain-containing protein [Salinibacillus xinjiangensis]